MLKLGNYFLENFPQSLSMMTVTAAMAARVACESMPILIHSFFFHFARKRGGYEAEKREHDNWIKAERRKILNSVRATLALRKRSTGDDCDIVLVSDRFICLRTSFYSVNPYSHPVQMKRTVLRRVKTSIVEAMENSMIALNVAQETVNVSLV